MDWGAYIPLDLATHPLAIFLLFIFALPFYVAAIAVAIRRCHDRNHRAWWMLLSLIPLINILWALYLGLAGPVHHNNRYGIRI